MSRNSALCGRNASTLFDLPRTDRVPNPERIVSHTISDSGDQHPHIVLTGEWLREAGFPIGARYLVMADTPGYLAIVQLDDEGDAEE